MQLLLAALTFVAALAIVAAVAFVAVLTLAGPHADLLPPTMQVILFVVGWLAVLILPGWAAWSVWRRVGRRSKYASPS